MSLPALPIAVAALTFFPLVGLFALWVSSRGWQWFVRALLLVLLPTPLLLIEAPDLMLVVLFGHLAVFGGLVGYRLFVKRNDEELASRSDAGPFRWSVADLLLATAIAAVVVLLSQVELAKQNSTLIEMIGCGGVFGFSVLVPAYLVFGKRRLIGRGLVVAMLVLAAIAVCGLFFMPPPMQNRLSSASETLDFSNFFIHTPMLPVTGVVTLVVLVICRLRFRCGNAVLIRRRYHDWLHRAVVYVGWPLVVLALFASTLCAAWTYSRLLLSYPEAAMAEGEQPTGPNGYLELVEAGKALSSSQLPNMTHRWQPPKLVRAEVELHRSQFDLVDQALKRPLLTAKPWSDYDLADLWSGNLNTAMPMRNVALALLVKSRLELKDGNANQAMEDGLRGIRLRIPTSRSGVLVDHLCGVAWEGMATGSIYWAIAGADSNQLQTAQQVLSEISRLPSDPAELIRQDRDSYWRLINWKYRLVMLQTEAASTNPSGRLELMAISEKACRAVRNQLMTHIALELFQRDQQRYPASLQELVPKWLPAEPLDPFVLNQTPLVYQLNDNGETYLLYSIGPNGRDDGGALDEDDYWSEEAGDVNFAERCRLNEEEYQQSAQPDEEFEYMFE